MIVSCRRMACIEKESTGLCWWWVESHRRAPTGVIHIFWLQGAVSMIINHVLLTTLKEDFSLILFFVFLFLTNTAVVHRGIYFFIIIIWRWRLEAEARTCALRNAGNSSGFRRKAESDFDWIWSSRGHYPLVRIGENGEAVTVLFIQSRVPQPDVKFRRITSLTAIECVSSLFRLCCRLLDEMAVGISCIAQIACSYC